MSESDRLLTLVETAIGADERRTQRWRDAGHLDSGERTTVRVGIPDAAAQIEESAAFLRFTGRPLPIALVTVTTRYNGIQVDVVGQEAPDPPLAIVAARTLRSPDWLPFGDLDSRWTLDESPIVLHHHVVVIGEVQGSGWMVLAIPHELSSPTLPVYWVDHDFARVEPVRIAESLDAYVETWCAEDLCTALVLQRAAVPGWDG